MIVLCLLSVLILPATTQEQDAVAINITQDKIILEHDTDPISYEVSCQAGKNITEVLNMTLTNQGNLVVLINSNVTGIFKTGGNLTSNLPAGYLKIEFVAVSPKIHFGFFNCAVAGISENETIIRWNTTTLRHISKPLIEVNKIQSSGIVYLNVTCTTTVSCLEVTSMGFHRNNITEPVNISSPSMCGRLNTISQSSIYSVNETFLCAFGLNVEFYCSVNYTSNNPARVRRSVNSISLKSDTKTEFVGSAFGEECRYNDSCKTSSAFCDTTLSKPICKCTTDLYYDKENDRCTNIEPCPEDSNYIYFKDGNACYTIKRSSTNDSWDKVCTEEYAVALPFNSDVRMHLINRLWTFNFYSNTIYEWMLSTNQSDATSLKTFQIIISTNHSLDVMNKPQWFLPSGEKLVDVIPVPDKGWVSSPSSCLYILYDSQDSTVRMSPDCNFIEPYKGCFIQLPNKSCEQNVDELHHYTWNYTRGGAQVNQSCPNTHKGQVTRECQTSGVWKPPLYNCILKSLEDIQANLTQDIINPSDAMSNLINELPVNVNGSDKTNTTLYIGDLLIIKDILENVTYKILNTSVTKQQTEDFLTISSFVVDHEKNGAEWRSRVENVGKGAEEFLSVVDNFIAKATESLQNNNQSSLNIAKQNLVLQYAKIETSNPSSILFPTALENDPKWNTTAISSMFLNYTAFYDQGVTAYSVVLYRNLSQSVPSTLSERSNNKDISVNSQVLSVQMLPKAPNPLNPNIEFTFLGFQNMDNAEKHCSFWKLNETSNVGTWSTDGCREIFSNSTHVKCACSHLTNFALLISPFVPPKEHVRILGIISIVGISISMAALLITIGIHALHWRLVKSDNSIMLVSLCVVLLVGNALFLGGVNRTDNAVVCTVIAAVLHYLFLVAFFLMLAEGVTIFIKIVFIFNKTSYIVHMLAISLVVPLIIVGISMGVTKLEGYGDGNFCWLSRENGVFWAFAGPAGLVILINFIVIGLLTKIMCRRKPGVDKSVFQKTKLTAIKLMVVVPVMGVSWISGILSVDEDSLWLQYVFCIFNSLQGVAILIFHVVRNKQLHKAIQAQRARNKSLEDFTSSSKGSNFHIELKEKIMVRLGIKQSSSTTVLASNTSALNLTEYEKSFSLNQNTAFLNERTDIDSNKIDDPKLKDDDNSWCSNIRDASELKTFRREEPETVSHTETTSSKNLIDNINDVEVKPNTKKFNFDKTNSETEK